MGNPWKLSGWGVKHYKTTSDKNAEKMFRAIAKGKKVEIESPTSTRSLYKGYDEDGNYNFVGGEVAVGTKKDADKVAEMGSHAVDKVRYNPTTNTAYVTFHGGDKEYEYSVTPEEFEEFIRSPSKGQHIVNVWRINNRKDGF